MPHDHWQPTASIENIRLRSTLLRKTRAFFAERGVLETETPILCSHGVTDPNIQTLKCRVHAPGIDQSLFYLQSSPEYAMKRLLAAGSGPIYQICKAFRDSERGKKHNPEFTILEWYRPGWDQHRLMDEVQELLVELLGVKDSLRMSYAELFKEHVGLDPHRAKTEKLRDHALRLGLPNIDSSELGDWLDLIMSHHIEEKLGSEQPLFIFDYPTCQAALSRIRPGAPPVAERFEVYFKGVELANGYHELLDVTEHRKRFAIDLERRRRTALPQPAGDPLFLKALEAGLPPCAGVALGFDRILMLAAGAASIDEVLAFPLEFA